MVILNAFSTATLDKITGGFNYTPTFTAVTNELANVANGLFAGVTNGSTYFGPLTAFNNTNLTSVDLSNTNIEALNYGDLDQSINTNIKIQSGTFANASNLTSITLPASCNQFGLNYSYYSGAFARCTSLQNLNFKNFEVNTTPSGDSQTAPTGFAQITQDTWVQVANIMNALAYFGQQNITAVAPEGVGTDENPINTQTQINGITYNVNADPVAESGTWAKWVNDKTESSNVSSTPMILRGLAEWAAPRSNFNYPINAYPAGSYGYSVTQPEQSAQSKADATDPQVTVKYPAGLGTSVSANFKDNSAASLSVQMSNGDSVALGFGSNGPLLNGSGSTADSSVVFNTSVANASSITTGSTITLTPNSLRPQSVWYTVSASGSDGSNNITQAGYTLTQDESNNIFAVSANKIAGALNDGDGGVGSSNTSSGASSTNVYTTAVGGTASNNNASSNGTAVAAPSANGLKTNNNGSADITLSQNYLPLGITSNVKDAYFNHNGIIWHYHNGFVSGTNDGIWIEGKVNAYIGGTIQGQNSGAKYLGVSGWTSTASGQNNAYGMTLANGVYNNGNGLTSVSSLSGVEVGSTLADVYGIDNADLSGSGDNSKNTVCYPYVSLFGGKVTSGNVVSTNPYSKTVGPANVTVKLTLVPGTNNNQGN